MNPIFVYVITKQPDVKPEDRYLVEGDESGLLFYGYRTKKNAEAAVKAMVPEGKNPWEYAGLRVERRRNHPTCILRDDDQATHAQRVIAALRHDDEADAEAAAEEKLSKLLQ